MADVVKFKPHEIMAEVGRLYIAKCPRIGQELDDFIRDQIEYFSVDERTVRRAIGQAQLAQDAQFRAGIQTRAQVIGERMGVTEVEMFDVLRGAMQAKKKKLLVDGSGKPVKDQDGEVIYSEQPDWINRLRAVDLAAKLNGSYAPKQVHVEGRHEHHVNISDDEIRRQFDELASGLGYQVIPAEYSAIASGTPTGDAEDSANEDHQGGDGLLLLADRTDADD